MSKEIYDLTFEIKNKNKAKYLKVLSNRFVEKNKYRAKLIINNRIKDFNGYILINSLKKDDYAKIKLIFIEKIFDMGHMFCCCNSLKKIARSKIFRGFIINKNIEINEQMNNYIYTIIKAKNNNENSENYSENKSSIENSINNKFEYLYENEILPSYNEISSIRSRFDTSTNIKM